MLALSVRRRRGWSCLTWVALWAARRTPPAAPHSDRPQTLCTPANAPHVSRLWPTCRAEKNPKLTGPERARLLTRSAWT
eukprot:3544066-Rhodomonas_salina.1